MWTPNPQGLAEVQAMLRQGSDPKASTDTMTRVRQQLETLSVTNTEFIRYLVYIFGHGSPPSEISSTESASRGLAGVLLKNTIDKNWDKLDANTLGYIFDAVLPCLKDPIRLIRSTAGHILAKLVAKTPILQNGSDLLQRLQQFVRQEEDDFLADGASLAMTFIAEDAGAVLDSDEAGRPLNHLIPFWIEQANHVKPLLRERALDCIECFFSSTPRALSINVDAYLAALSKLHNDASARVRRKVLRGLCNLIQYMPERITPDLYSQMAQVSVRAMEDDEDEVVREGCEFFDVSLVCNNQSTFASLLVPLLPKLVPLLLAKMTYREEELFELEDELKADAHIPDRAEEWKPAFHTGASGWSAKPADLDRDDEGDDGEDGRGEGPDEGPYWTTRRLASLVLDRLSVCCDHSYLAPHFLPTLSARMQSSEWTFRESAILALGAVAHGKLIEDLIPHLPMLIPYLINQCNDERHVLIRRIALWTLSRFSAYIAESTFLLPVLEVVLGRFKDVNKSVQSSALGTLAEIFQSCAGKPVLVPYLRIIVEQMSLALDSLQVNNVCHLLDAFTALFKFPPTNQYLSDGSLIGLFMPKIWQRFAMLAPGDVNLPAMTWFLAQACSTLGPSFFPYAEPALQRCRDIMEESLSLAEAALSVGEPLGYGDYEHLQCTLELLSSLVTSLRAEFPRSPNSQICAQLVFKCASYIPDPDVMEVSVGVLGDMCMFCPALFKGSEVELFRLFSGIAGDFDAARMNNGPCRVSVWALAELVAAAPFVVQANPLILKDAVMIAGNLLLFREQKTQWTKDIADVSVILAGNLFLASPDAFDEAFSMLGENEGHTLEAMHSWTTILNRMAESLPGRIRAIEAWALYGTRRPDLFRAFVPIALVTAAAFDMRTVNPEAHQLLQQMVQKIQTVYAENWPKVTKPLNDSHRNALRQLYQLPM